MFDILLIFKNIIFRLERQLKVSLIISLISFVLLYYYDIK